GDGNDYLFGDDGNDTIWGGRGDDDITVGDGESVVAFAPGGILGFGNDDVYFVDVDDDAIDLTEFDLGITFAELNASFITYADIDTNGDLDDAVINFGEGTITIYDVGSGT